MAGSLVIVDFGRAEKLVARGNRFFGVFAKKSVRVRPDRALRDEFHSPAEFLHLAIVIEKSVMALAPVHVAFEHKEQW